MFVFSGRIHTQPTDLPCEKDYITMLNSWKTDAGKSETTGQSEASTRAAATPSNASMTAPADISISVPKAAEPAKSVGNSTIDACLTMRGDLESDADILVKGKVFGNVTCNLLIVDSGANIEGGINAKEVVIRGKVTGINKSETVRLDKTAEGASDIYQNTFIAEEGASILGSMKALKDAPKDLAAPAAADKKAA